MRDRIERVMREGLACDCCSAEIKALFQEWIDNRECRRPRTPLNKLNTVSNTLKTKEVTDRLVPLMEACQCDICKQLLALKSYMVKKSQWIFGGDGWGYDIGFGGLEPKVASTN